MTYLYLYIPGMAHEVQLSESADRIPNMGDRLEIDAVRLDKSSRWKRHRPVTALKRMRKRNGSPLRNTWRKVW